MALPNIAALAGRRFTVTDGSSGSGLGTDRHCWFVLPVQPARKSEADVPSHHRAAFRRREALRGAAESVLTAALGRSAPRREAAAQAVPRIDAPFMPFLPQEPAWIP